MDREIVKEESTYDFYREQTLLLTEKYKELKQRIDKAIEYVSNLCNYANVEYYSDNQLKYITIRPYYIEELLNILKGEDKE